MSWHDEMRPASFRDVAFFVEAADGGGGRRAAVHEFPMRDVPYVEDLGRRARSFTLKAFVFSSAENGFNYMPARDALIAAIEAPGPGVLVHPYRGDQSVSCIEASWGETTDEGGKATFILTFVESGAPLYPTGAENTRAAVDAAADEALIAAQSDFSEQFSVEDAPEFVSLSATDLLRQVNTAIDQAIRGFPTSLDGLNQLVPGLFTFVQQLDTLIRAPITLGGAIVNLYGFIGTSLTRPFHTYQALRTAWQFGLDGTQFAVPALPRTTPTRVQQADNQDAVLALAQRVSVIEAARAVADIEFKPERDAPRDVITYQAAATIREQLADELDRLMEGATNDKVFQTLADLHAATVRDITARSAQLGRLVAYTPIATLPAIVVAYDLYEDAIRDEEIVALNTVRHPGFVPAGTPLQVIANA